MSSQERLDLHLVRNGWATSRRAAKELIASGRVRVNGHPMRKGEPVMPDDRIDIADIFPAPTLQPNPALRVKVLFADSAVLVVNKPPLRPCHPLNRDERDTVMNAVVAMFPETATAGDKPIEGGLVHRLDNGTSGALIIARTPGAFRELRHAIRKGLVLRTYEALVAGVLDSETEIATPIAHHPRNPRKMITVASSKRHSTTRPVIARGRPAFTSVMPVASYPDFTLVSAKPRTGSRHQIRVHLASIGHPLAGDLLYGGPGLPALAPGRLWLHLARLELDSPASGQVKIEAPLPADLAEALKSIR